MRQRKQVWTEAGREIARLHGLVKDCPDPNGYLDTPGYDLDLEPGTAKELNRLMRELEPHVRNAKAPRRFVHDDLHDMNIMCTSDGHLLSILDWGDAGWGDPTVDFASVPLDMLPAALEGYSGDLGDRPEARFLWAKIEQALSGIGDGIGTPLPLDDYWALWRPASV